MEVYVTQKGDLLYLAGKTYAWPVDFLAGESKSYVFSNCNATSGTQN